MIDCTCVFVDHRLVTYCGCLGEPRRPGYLVDPPALRGPGEHQPAWSCHCRRPAVQLVDDNPTELRGEDWLMLAPLLRTQRHAAPWQCIKESVVAKWAAQAGCNLKVAREMFWLELEFGR